MYVNLGASGLDTSDISQEGEIQTQVLEISGVVESTEESILDVIDLVRYVGHIERTLEGGIGFTDFLRDEKYPETHNGDVKITAKLEGRDIEVIYAGEAENIIDYASIKLGDNTYGIDNNSIIHPELDKIAKQQGIDSIYVPMERADGTIVSSRKNNIL